MFMIPLHHVIDFIIFNHSNCYYSTYSAHIKWRIRENAAMLVPQCVSKQTKQNGGYFKYKNAFCFHHRRWVIYNAYQWSWFSKYKKQIYILCCKTNENTSFKCWCTTYQNNEWIIQWHLSNSVCVNDLLKIENWKFFCSQPKAIQNISQNTFQILSTCLTNCNIQNI